MLYPQSKTMHPFIRVEELRDGMEQPGTGSAAAAPLPVRVLLRLANDGVQKLTLAWDLSANVTPPAREQL